MSAIRDFVRRVRTTGVKRSTKVKTVAMGRGRVFEAWDIGHDTYIFEKLVTSHLSDHPSVLIVEKRVLKSRTKGRVFTMTTGNHSVAAFPLLDGRFWKLSNLPSQRRGETLMYSILCANVVKDTIEISQREVPAKILFAADEWLMDTVGFSMRDIVMGDRNDVTIEHYRQLGQEWRVKPLAWTINEINVALAASKKRISTKLTYYHSMKGVHFLTYPEFKKFTDLARTNCDEYLKGLKELVGVYEGNKTSFVRMPKHRGHHEIEFFGLRRGIALEKLVPEVEKLMEAIALGKIGQLGIIQRAEEILVLYSSLLNKPEYADERSKLFIETLYMYITGEIYSVVGEGSTPAFDDRRTALPGATFVDGRPVFHIGADDRSEVLPNADVKFFLDAKIECRANRRLQDDYKRGVETTYAQVLESLQKRDYSDTHREFSKMVVKCQRMCYNKQQHASVAQLDRAPASDAGCRWFESNRVHHKKPPEWAVFCGVLGC